MIPLQNLTIGQLLERTARKFPQRHAIEYAGCTWSYADLDQLSDALAAGLLALGVKRGDHVAIWGENEPSTVLSFFAFQKIGAVTAMICTTLQPASLQQALRDSDATCLAFGDGYKDLDFPAICARLPEIPGLNHLLYMGNRKVGKIAGDERTITMRQVMQMGAEFAGTLKEAKTLVQPEDPAVILFTSGTTSSPKAVVTSHFSRVNSGIQQAADLRATEQDRFCAALPLFHCFSMSANMMAAVAVGACLFLPENRRTRTILAAFDRQHCTILHSVPTLLHSIIRRPDLNEYDLRSLRIGLVGGANCSPEQFIAFAEKLDYCLLSSLGMTEATAGITITRPEDSLQVRSTTVGRFMDHIEGMIADPETGKPLPGGVQGEICVRGYGVMMGYYKRPDLTAQVIDGDGWLHTGDMGYIAADGCLHITGRLKELIIRAGENISPAEVETVLLHHPAVRECKVVGVPDEHYGEELCACILPEKGRKVDPDALRELVGAELPAFKVPRHVLIFGELPRGVTGKINAIELARQATRMLAGAEEPSRAR